jgi:hypothetical protein
MNNTIPPITDPLGKYWNQPKSDLILIDDTHAVMSESTFKQLAEYSSSIPSGAYPGKMWKRYNGAHDEKCPPENRYWMLFWYGEHADPKLVSINHRIILVTA